jgi:hypothetical protein
MPYGQPPRLARRAGCGLAAAAGTAAAGTVAAGTVAAGTVAAPDPVAADARVTGAHR